MFSEATLRNIIDQAVRKGIEAGKKQVGQDNKSIYRATERRLYAYPDLKDKVKDDLQYIKELQVTGPKKRSKDILRFKKSGVRLSDEEILEGLIQDLRANIAANQYEIELIEKAIEPLTDDPYFKVISGRFFRQMSDEEIAKTIPCDPSTVRRNRGRLMNRISVRLFGAEAI